MRQERTVQASIFDLFAQHEIGCELKKASTWLDEHPAMLSLVAADLRRDGGQKRRDQGPTTKGSGGGGARAACSSSRNSDSREAARFTLRGSALTSTSWAAIARLASSSDTKVRWRKGASTRRSTWSTPFSTLALSRGRRVRVGTTATA